MVPQNESTTHSQPTHGPGDYKKQKTPHPFSHTSPCARARASLAAPAVVALRRSMSVATTPPAESASRFASAASARRHGSPSSRASERASSCLVDWSVGLVGWMVITRHTRGDKGFVHTWDGSRYVIII